MSFFSKFTKKIQPQMQNLREQFMQILDNVLKPNIQFNLKDQSDILAQYLMKSECKLNYNTCTNNFLIRDIQKIYIFLNKKSCNNYGMKSNINKFNYHTKQCVNQKYNFTAVINIGFLRLNSYPQCQILYKIKDNSRGRLNQNQKNYLRLDNDILLKFIVRELYDIQEHISNLFEFLATITFDFHPIQVIKLLAILHQLLSKHELSQNISIKIRTVKMPWLQNIGTLKGIKDSNQNYQQSSSIIQLNEIPYQEPSFQFLYVQQCYFYLQLLSQNIDLYYAISFNNYPYSTKYEIDHRLQCTWIYKIQNIMNYAIQLLAYNRDYIEIQKVIYQDMLQFHSFICQEITQVLDSYATLGRCYTLSLYEIFCESNKHYEQLKRFWKEIGLQQPEQCLLSNSLLQEFLLFVSKLKLLNQIVYKKKLTVPFHKIKDIKKIHIRKGSQCLNEEENILVEDNETHEEIFMSNQSKRNLRLVTSCAVQL